MQVVKKRILIWFMVFTLAASAAFALIYRTTIRYYLSELIHNHHIVSNKLLARENEEVSGIFYKKNAKGYDRSLKFNHLVLQVNNNSSFRINKNILNAAHEKNNILLTVEFWGNLFYNKYSIKNEPLKEIIDGSLDAKLQKIYNTLLDSDREIFVRINPEMELWVYNTPWENRDNYIEAYRHVVSFWQKKNPNLKFIWGPAGFNGCERYYPGDDVVDLISITLQSEAEKMYTRYPAYGSLENEIHRKLHRLRFFNKPVMIITSDKMFDKTEVANAVNDEIDSIAKYQDIAYDETLWNNAQLSIPNEEFQIGVYDPRKLLLTDSSITTEHLFLDFGHLQSRDSKTYLDDVFSRNHDVILTFEPWIDYGRITDPNVLANIVDGKYDTLIHLLYNDISNSNHTVYLRFAHEMEIPITRYAWQSKDPIIYIKAFRYFMQFPNPFPLNVKKVWGPAGDRGAPDYYPGDDVVDYVSFAAYGLPDKNITDFNKQIMFSTIFEDKIINYRYMNKPVFITEFGVKGPNEYKLKWMEDAAITLNKNPQVVGVNYFNMSDTPGAWGDIKEPDWSIDTSILHRFLEVLKKDNQ
ncbi:hypothetical protein ACE1ET_07340 [Saccharicrinis sp. FJH62]|uniref:hypothetical protein n=1 Tax=Saccharicrinis sp. FJH62 TaxID=3344657 RepID=UPI0035D517F2